MPRISVTAGRRGGMRPGVGVLFGDQHRSELDPSVARDKVANFIGMLRGL
jgi:hypothetical protein